MYAVVETGGKQYRVAVGDKLMVEKLDAEEGASIQLDRVLLVCDDGKVDVGAPLVKGTAVSATVLVQGRGEKIKVFKFKRRKKYRRTQGHRQSFTQLEITAIGGKSAKPKKDDAKKVKKAAPKKATEKTAKAAPAAKKKAKTKDKVKTKNKNKNKNKNKAKKASKADKLTKINGIGPVIEEKLNDLGVKTFKQIAEFTPEQAEEVDAKLSFKGRIEREEWIAQAKKLAD